MSIDRPKDRLWRAERRLREMRQVAGEQKETRGDKGGKQRSRGVLSERIKERDKERRSVVLVVIYYLC